MFSKRENILAFLVVPTIGVMLFLLAVDIYSRSLGVAVPCRIEVRPVPPPWVKYTSLNRMTLDDLAKVPLSCIRTEGAYLMVRDPNDPNPRMWGIDKDLIQTVVYLSTSTPPPAYP